MINKLASIPSTAILANVGIMSIIDPTTINLILTGSITILQLVKEIINLNKTKKSEKHQKPDIFVDTVNGNTDIYDIKKSRKTSKK